MELRKLAIIMAVSIAVFATTCSDAHTVHRRFSDDDVNYEDAQADEANDDYTQNDTGDESKPEETPVVILTQPTTYEVNETSTVRLECKVEPDKGTVAQWYKDGEMYFLGNIKMKQDATRVSIIPGSKDLLIKDILPEDSGIYRCEVVRRSSASINHTVVVLQSPRIIKISATNKGNVVEGSDLLLTCDVAGVPPPTVIWSRNIDNVNHRLTETDGEFSGNTVYLKNVSRAHGGKYYCYVFNNAGYDQSEIQINIAAKPRVSVHKTRVNSAVRVAAELQCSAHEDNNPHMRWYKDGRLIEDSSTQYTVATNGAHSNLTVIPVSDQDFGTFTCEAENSYGRHNKSIELVQSPIIENLDVEGGKMSWTVHSHQPLEAMEVQLRALDASAEWKILSVPLPVVAANKYDITYELFDKQLGPGKYEAVVKVKNAHSWSGPSDPVMVEIDAQPLSIQTASVIGFGSGNNGFLPQPSAILCISLIYLLVRMF